MPTMRVNHYDMAFVEQGAGAPLILIHGTASDYRLWAAQMEPFGAHYRTIAVSLRHYWPERWDGEGDDFSGRQHVLDIAAFIAAIGAAPAYLLGLSRGAGIAFRVAREYPELVRGLVLVEPGLPLDVSLELPQPPIAAPLSFAGMYTAALEKIRLGAVDEGLRPVADAQTWPGWWDEVPERIRQMFRDNAITLFAQVRDRPRPVTRQDAEAIRVPVLMVVGERSPETFRRTSEGLLGGLHDARMRIVSRASHVSHVDNPREFNEIILEFLQKYKTEIEQ